MGGGGVAPSADLVATIALPLPPDTAHACSAGDTLVLSLAFTGLGAGTSVALEALPALAAHVRALLCTVVEGQSGVLAAGGPSAALHRDMLEAADLPALMTALKTNLRTALGCNVAQLYVGALLIASQILADACPLPARTRTHPGSPLYHLCSVRGRCCASTMTMRSAVTLAGGRYVFDDATNVLWTVGANGDGTATTPRGALGSPTAGPGAAGVTSSSATARGPSGSAFTFPPSPRHGGGGAGGAAPGSPRRAPGVLAGDAVGFICSPWKRRHGIPW
jgi:hypothetical protein